MSLFLFPFFKRGPVEIADSQFALPSPSKALLWVSPQHPPFPLPVASEPEKTQTQEDLVNSFNERQLLSLEPVWKGNSALRNSSDIKNSLSTQDLHFW